MPGVEKSPGYDWTVWHTLEGDDGREAVFAMSVFGAMTAEAAIASARASLETAEGPFTGAIVRVERNDMKDAK
jgi:hypothetical protein